jgi:hypothetical protein
MLCFACNHLFTAVFVLKSIFSVAFAAALFYLPAVKVLREISEPGANVLCLLWPPALRRPWFTDNGSLDDADASFVGHKKRTAHRFLKPIVS